MRPSLAHMMGSRQSRGDALHPVQALEGWGTFPSIVIENPVSIATLVSIALTNEVPKDKVNSTPERTCHNQCLHGVLPQDLCSPDGPPKHACMHSKYAKAHR